MGVDMHMDVLYAVLVACYCRLVFVSIAALVYPFFLYTF